MVLWKLAISAFSVRKTRAVLTIAAIAFSVSLVVAVTSGYVSMEAAFYRFLAQFVGTIDAQITRPTEQSGIDTTRVLPAVRDDPDVLRAFGRLESFGGLIDLSGKAIVGLPANLIGIDRPDDVQVEATRLTSGKWFDSADGNVAVLDQVAARIIKSGKSSKDGDPALKVGDTFVLPGVNGNLTLTVVGISHKPTFFANFRQTVYLPINTLRRFLGQDKDPRVTRIMIDVKPGADVLKFAQRCRATLLVYDPLLQLKTTEENRAEMDRNLEGMHMMSYLGGMVSMLAATFIVFSTLSMGVAEQQRSLAMLRAIGAFKSQLARLVLCEGLVLSGFGVAIGIPLGILWIRLLAWQYDSFFFAGAVISREGIVFAAVATLLAALLASIMPAWRASRTSALDAMSPLAGESTTRAPVWTAAFGLFLISLDSVLLFGDWERWLGALGIADAAKLGRMIGFYGHFIIGLPGLMIGFFLLAPMFVWLLEAPGGLLITSLFRVKRGLLRQQLTGGLWRAAGTCAALMVGLAIFVVLQTHGRTMMGGWQLPTRFPDMFIVSGTGLDPTQQDRLREMPGVRDRQLLPIAMAAPGYGTDMFSLGRAVIVPNTTMLFGMDPDLMFKMMDLDFRAGTASEAERMLQLGRHVVVTEEFRKLKQLKVGDTIPLQTKHGTIDYTIAGIVWSPGLDVLASRFDMGQQMEQRTAFSMFCSIDDIRNDFGDSKVRMFAVNVAHDVDRIKWMQEISEKLGQQGIEVYDVRHIKAEIIGIFNRILLLASTVAFAAMAVSALGVTNTIMASIRSRQWQFGILRSIGVTRGGLVRLVLAEATLLGVIGCGLGLAAGFVMAINAKQLAVVMLGYDPPQLIPWGPISAGTAVVLATALLASLLPAIGTAKTEPLTLLQAGRAAT